ncbi:MAG TPA: phosphomannomutase/phosphoglucomutase [Candidatus Dojkabacteria bacterium]
MSKVISKEQLSKVFHAYDIRGRVPGELDEDFFEALGTAFAHFLKAKKVIVGHDIRTESKTFMDALVRGIRSHGCDVVDAGEIATEMIYFATGSDDSYDGGIIITASHNPTGWNGAKMVARGARALSGDYGLNEIQNLMLNPAPQSSTEGSYARIDLYPEFKKKILNFLGDSDLSSMNLIVDAGNGIGGKIFDYIFDETGANIERMYFEPDGTFPNHVPNPLEEENVKEIKEKCKERNAIGIALDGDSDRAFFIDSKGRNPSGAYTGAIFAKYFIGKEPGAKIIHDPRVIWAIQKEIEKLGGVSIINKPGHSFFKDRMKKENAVFACELSSHFYYRDFFFADTGMATVAVMLKILAEGLDLSKELDYFYETYPASGEINFEVENIPEVIERLEKEYSDGKKDTTDGISIEYDDWRFNVRSSNTQPLLRLNIEGISKELIIEHYKKMKELIGGERMNEPALAGLD